MRLVLAVAALAFVTACQTTQKAANPVGMDVLSAYTISDIEVEVPATAKIWWGAAEQDYAKTVGCERPVAPSREQGETPAPTCDYDAVIESPEAKEYLRDRVASLMEDAKRKHFDGALPGDKAAVLSVRVDEVYVVSGGQAVMVGGAHRMSVTVGLKDAETGQFIVPPSRFQETGGYAPGGLFALMVEAASEDPPIRMADAIAADSRAWMLNEATQ